MSRHIALSVVRLDDIKLPLVNKFYNYHRARGRANKADQIWVVYAEAEIIAACRIQTIEASLFLSTLMVAPDWRGKGVASLLLQHCLEPQTQPVFSFVYQTLIDFYRQNGFNYALTLPTSLITLFDRYRHRKVAAMQYSKGST